MTIALVIDVAMIIWAQSTIQEGLQFVRDTHNMDSCLMGGWCGGIPVLLAAPIAFTAMLFLGCYGYSIQKEENEKLASERRETS